MIKLKVVSENGSSALVEFFDHDADVLKRVTIPKVEIHNDAAPKAVLEAGIPYGVAWDELDLSINPRDLCNALRGRGIWTREDALANPEQVIKVVRSLSGILAKILSGG